MGGRRREAVGLDLGRKARRVAELAALEPSLASFCRMVSSGGKFRALYSWNEKSVIIASCD